MHTFTQTALLQQVIRKHKNLDHTVGLVPTMGNLHAGHLKLIAEAKRHCDFVVCTIFVNPLQFGVDEDLEDYPRTLETDVLSLKASKCDCLFHPNSDELYPEGIDSQTKVSVPELGINHCGISRPEHFEGVTTVVAKLFNICQPDRAFFGLKDYQQYLIIQRMVTDMQYSIKIIGVETQREPSGLAMSSRNTHLTPEQNKIAPLFHQTLVSVSDQILSGDKNFSELENSAKLSFATANIALDYFSICNAITLLPAQTDNQELVVLGAVFLGDTRLIDNIRVSLTYGTSG